MHRGVANGISRLGANGGSGGRHRSVVGGFSPQESEPPPDGAQESDVAGVGSLERTPAGAMRRFPDLGANFEALSIQIPHHPCQAARELRGQRFLAEEMPELPLPGCDRECECTFIYHRERRDEQNRRAPYLSADDGDNDFESLEHRSSSDRRKR